MSKSDSVFISYRRSDASSFAILLKEKIREKFPHCQIFLDVESINAGENFESAIKHSLKNCQVFLVVMGSGWLSERETGKFRIFEKNDYVHLEITHALSERKKIIPILLDDTKMPQANQLPPDIQEITKLNAVEIRHSRSSDDFNHLLAALNFHQNTRFKRTFLKCLASILMGGIFGCALLFIFLYLFILAVGEGVGTKLGITPNGLLVDSLAILSILTRQYNTDHAA